MRVPTLALSLAAALLLGACDAPPKPPAVNETTRRPANSAWVVDLQSCRSELANTRIDAAESARRADFAMATADRMVALQQAIELIKPSSPASVAIASPTSIREVMQPLANSIYTVQFDYGSSRVNLAPTFLRAVLDQARTAPLVVLRGRTDGTQDVAAEGRIARERAQAVKSHLVAAGLDPNRIRTTWQPTGDHAADNGTPDGQARNRRVEIEVYAALPTVAPALTTGQP
ncbi:OmpA/MotB domain protein [Leptothrix cholodnii SP-6]|uniref:OmpA/MotB domain protein n=1 Tax=Leptothrix cholodnii (strain ATCC 51168 / LMG 8142 / SP-6) TaxID=395495 RepID=B1Y1V3_LEPCP|nr:OmpA family protein [Leptothrix cholodnii]ACB33133.1 OmpA/MotB domain protein [Leptothrix cholodnii SP-6]